MKITPLEIRQKAFEKAFRGLDKDEVNAFLLTLSQEWERMQDEHKELRYKLEAAEKEVAKLREVESSLFKTLKTADDTAANLIEQASKAAELHMKETQMKAEALMSEAKNKARAMIERAEDHSREIIEDLHEEVKTLEQTYKSIENHRDNLINSLRMSSSDIMEKVDRIEKARSGKTFDEQLKKVKALSRVKKEIFSDEDVKLESPTEVRKLSVEAEVKPAQKTPVKEEVKAKTVTESRKVIKVAGEEYSLEEISSTGSFFDELN
ncbi:MULTISPECIES: DivIVA domain-containing protein [unclassified Imperialibacter]|uniref:DivIVA domain-containing protein n=1 Tax=unclassified Imperialibacter TaxID=2629706 RepID=UPI0012541168|nr:MULTISPECIES: DivIVA domain-containing protein [unclassified Imperialibacter]CAD5255255.1 Cell division protein DivIVA [Imperialibacter sp. 75]CAD5263819.1 Cell division protein DivIVA [Imperialibacter sp. 89]VVT35509.1 Cell division protein DivIVA [Imperialibacter sp. EC-SDR9]